MNGRKRRDSAEIMYAILNSAQAGQRKTRVMYDANLNLKQLNAYLTELTANQMLVFQPAGRFYVTTERGRAFAKAFEHYRETTELLREQEAGLGGFFTRRAKRAVEVQP